VLAKNELGGWEQIYEQLAEPSAGPNRTRCAQAYLFPGFVVFPVTNYCKYPIDVADGGLRPRAFTAARQNS